MPSTRIPARRPTPIQIAPQAIGVPAPRSRTELR